jgi:hypothetical protein
MAGRTVKPCEEGAPTGVTVAETGAESGTISESLKPARPSERDGEDDGGVATRSQSGSETRMELCRRRRRRSSERIHRAWGERRTWGKRLDARPPDRVVGEAAGRLGEVGDAVAAPGSIAPCPLEIVQLEKVDLEPPRDRFRSRTKLAKRGPSKAPKMLGKSPITTTKPWESRHPDIA